MGMLRFVVLPALLVVLLVAGSAFHLNDSTEVPSSADPMGILGFVAKKDLYEYLLRADGTLAEERRYKGVTGSDPRSLCANFSAVTGWTGKKMYLVRFDGGELPDVSGGSAYPESDCILVWHGERDYSVFRYDLSFIGAVKYDLLTMTKRLPPDDPRTFRFNDGDICGFLDSSLNVIFSTEGDSIDPLPNGNSLACSYDIPGLPDKYNRCYKLVDATGRVLHEFTGGYAYREWQEPGAGISNLRYYIVANVGPDQTVILDDTGSEIFRGKLGVSHPVVGCGLFKLVEDGILYLTDFGRRRFEIGPEGNSKAEAGYFAGGLCDFMRDGELWGFMDAEGNEVITPRYREVPWYDFDSPAARERLVQNRSVSFTTFNFGRGLAVVWCEDFKYELINKVGENVAPYRYDWLGVSPRWPGFAFFLRDDKIGFLDSTGAEVFVTDEADTVHVTFPKSGRFFLQGASGSYVVDIATGKHTYVGNLAVSDDYYPEAPGWTVTDGRRCGFINLNGEFLVDLRWDKVLPIFPIIPK